jgi:hypothetical protein
MEFLQKMEEKIFEKFDFELSSKKDTEIKVAQYLEEKFNVIKGELQKESKTRYENIENLEYYFEVYIHFININFENRKNYQKFKKDLKLNKLKEKKTIITTSKN